MLSNIPNRYTKTVLVEQTHVCWGLIAQDVCQTIADRIVSPIQKRLNRLAVCAGALAIAAAVGVNAAITVYQQLSN